MPATNRTPEAVTPAAILQRALDAALQPAPRPEREHGFVHEALREAVQPATIAELIVLFACFIAPAAILFLSGGE